MGCPGEQRHAAGWNEAPGRARSMRDQDEAPSDILPKRAPRGLTSVLPKEGGGSCVSVVEAESQFLAVSGEGGREDRGKGAVSGLSALRRAPAPG